SSMGTALEKRQFQVHFQPKFDVKSNKPYGAEALVRWIDPEKGMIFPGDFIPIFERNGFISKLDFYVWDCVCQNISKWNSQGKTPMPVSVNVSRVNLYNPNLVDVFLELIKKYNIPAWQLNLEITESAYTQNTELVLQTTEKLQKNGFVVMMDDFGNGYSSLNILKNIPVDVLKIDTKFLPEKNDIRAERILASVIKMAKCIGIPVIMEGVETKEQTSFLESLDCDYIQGYYFARPMPLEEYEDLMSLQCLDK
ncbi:MAG: EAL domain-containing protein, partial [Oscillospiraceae bacterium]